MDNGAFSGFDPVAFERMLHRFRGETGCVFVTCPDVVGDAVATIELWREWSPVIRRYGYRPAWVAQDGVTNALIPRCDVVFVGGSTEFKESRQVHNLCAYAKARGVWVHWGRVNSKRRFRLAMEAGADSVDGSGFSMYPDTRIPMLEKWTAQIKQTPRLNFQSA